VPGYVKKRSKKDRQRWMAIWNKVFREGGSESDAFKAANGALNLSAADARGKPIVCVSSSVFPDWDAAGVYQVQVLRTGKWPDHPTRGDLVVTNEDLADAVRNFRGSSLKPFLDYNHAITDRDVKPGDQDAIGWMRDMWIEDLEGNKLEPDDAESSKEKVLVLKAEYEVNAEANEKIKEKKYALYSPTWYPAGTFMNSETGEYQGLTVVGGAATNIPYIDGMEGFIAIAAEQKHAVIMAEMMRLAQLNVAVPHGVSVEESVAAFKAMGLTSKWVGEYEACLKVPDDADIVKVMGDLSGAGYRVTYFSQDPVEYAKRIGKKAAEAEVTEVIVVERKVFTVQGIKSPERPAVEGVPVVTV
jgi:hypothetical protein